MSTPAPPSSFDDWINQASMPRLEADLNEKKVAFQKKLVEYERLRNELAALDQEIERRDKVLGVLREIRPESPETDAQRGGDNAEPPQSMTKPEMAERILRGALKPLYPREVRDIAVQRGWLPDEPNAANQLSVAMNKGVKTKRFLRDEEGRYSLPRDDAGSNDDDQIGADAESFDNLLAPNGSGAQE